MQTKGSRDGGKHPLARAWRVFNEFSEHKRKVQVLGAVSYVDVAVLRRHGRVVERQAGPQQAADHAHFAGALELEAPRRCERQRLM